MSSYNEFIEYIIVFIFMISKLGRIFLLTGKVWSVFKNISIFCIFTPAEDLIYFNIITYSFAIERVTLLILNSQNVLNVYAGILRCLHG